MLHYTLHTDDSRESSIDELSDEAIQMLTGLLTPGMHRIPGVPGYSCRIALNGEGLIATASHHKRQCVTFGVAPNEEAAEQLWPRLERLYFQITEMPGIRSTDLPTSRRPTATPWCAVVRMAITPEEVGWIDLFERCLCVGMGRKVSTHLTGWIEHRIPPTIAVGLSLIVNSCTPPSQFHT